MSVRDPSVKHDLVFALLGATTEGESVDLHLLQSGAQAGGRCDEARLGPCLRTCAVEDERNHCGVEPGLAPPDWITALPQNREAVEASWRACGTDAVEAKRMCCDALWTTALGEGIVAENARADDVDGCVGADANTVPHWIADAGPRGRVDYVSELAACLSGSELAKAGCCVDLTSPALFEGDEAGLLACNTPAPGPIGALLDRHALIDPDAAPDPETGDCVGRAPEEMRRVNYGPQIWPAQDVFGSPIRRLADGGLQVGLEWRNRCGVRATVWRDVVYARDPTDQVLAPYGRRALATSRRADGTHFWAVDLLGREGAFQLWAGAPFFSVDRALYGPEERDAPAGAGRWFFVEGAAGQGVGANTLSTITPVDGHPGQWRLAARGVNCTPVVH
jgi:hypothetical protein